MDISLYKRPFPNEDVPCIEACFNRINQSKVFSRLVFEDLLTMHKVPKCTWKLMEKELNAHEFSIVDDLEFISDEELQQINEAYPPRRSEQLTGKRPVLDPLIIILGDEEQCRKDRALDDEKYKFMRVHSSD